MILPTVNETHATHEETMKANSEPELKKHIIVPISCLAGLVDSGVISAAEARESVLSRTFAPLRPQLLLEALLTIRGLENGEELIAQMKANLLDRIIIEVRPDNPHKYKEEKGRLIDELISDVTGKYGPGSEIFQERQNILVHLNEEEKSE
jgi:hypothetical protein